MLRESEIGQAASDMARYVMKKAAIVPVVHFAGRPVRNRSF
jgi:hypothetical protein